jgi:hypothetical protein
MPSFKPSIKPGANNEKRKATEAAQNTKLNRNDTSASNARAIIIQALRAGPKTTIELREDWGVMAPAPRILELKLRGYVIASVPVSACTADGVLHRGWKGLAKTDAMDWVLFTDLWSFICPRYRNECLRMSTAAKRLNWLPNTQWG